MRSIADIINDLSQPIAPQYLRDKTKGGQKMKYIPWYFAVKLLDQYAPGWTYEIRNMIEAGGKLIQVARITIPCAEGLIFREATGQEDEDISSWGDSSSNGESMALRRAAAKFGLGLYLYFDKKAHQQPTGQPQPAAASKSAPAQATPPKQTRTQTAEQLRADLLDDIKRTCNLLNKAGDLYNDKKWTGGTLKKFIGDEFQTDGGLDALSPEYLKQLLGKLNLRLDHINSAAPAGGKR